MDRLPERITSERLVLRVLKHDEATVLQAAAMDESELVRAAADNALAMLSR